MHYMGLFKIENYMQAVISAIESKSVHKNDYLYIIRWNYARKIGGML